VSYEGSWEHIWRVTRDAFNMLYRNHFHMVPNLLFKMLSVSIQV
jgi:hypothetical protein